MNIFKKRKILVTHNGTFHADDLFAAASLSILNKGNIKIIRTRDPKIISTGDYVFDVGGQHDGVHFFDHHQKGGGGVRENGIPYSSFGLIWKKYGEQICGNKEVADKIDKKLVQAIDANDNGINLFTTTGEVSPYQIQDIFYNFRPSWKEKQDYDASFMNLLPFVVEILKREILISKNNLEAEEIVRQAYEKADDKRVIIFDDNYPWFETINKYPEPLYVITRRGENWRAEAVRKEKNNFENRKSFPATWAGKRDAEIAELTGVPDAIFCHNGCFLVVAKSKEGIIALVQMALLA